MKSSTFVPFLCLGLFNVTLGYNFWLIDSFTPAIYGGDELLSVSQNGNVCWRISARDLLLECSMWCSS
jgi:hypothetical protein